jgi:exodeoxyribonuclease VIII
MSAAAEIIVPEKPKFDGILDVAGNRVEIGKALYADISNHAYHSRSPGISSTSLKKYLPASPAPLLYHAYSHGEIPWETSGSKNIGSAYHALMLQPMSWEEEIKVFPEFPRGQITAGKAELRRLHPEVTWVEQEELDTAQRMRDVAMVHPEVQYLFSQMAEMRDGVVAGQAEVSGWYQDLHPVTGEGTMQLCKYRPDMRYCPDWTHNTWLGDLKSTKAGGAAPEEFARAIHDWGYHISAAHYMEGDHIIHGRRPKQFIFVAQESEHPFLVAVYVLEEKALAHGAKMRRRALEGIYQAKKSGEWPHYHYNKAVMIDLPQYVYNHEDFV